MTPGQWSRIKVILQPALELPPGQRHDFIVEQCAGDAALEREVEEYLRYEQAADDALRITKWHESEQEPEPEPAHPERTGPYRIIRKLGEGGMGVVYLAERDDGEYRQQVAVKVMKAGPQATGLLNRFRNERQILAQLDHPNIARLIDGGTTAAGQLYYVMEYVEGVPLTAYCREHRLSIRARLDLFSTICTAVSYAHRNLIIHRDLKPANILVTADGTPKLLDFGLAKVFHDVPEAEQLTVSLAPMMTPGYASPEQVRGRHLTTATDVYSLGVVLYEMLTGASPYVVAEKTAFETCRAICEQEPRPPSTAAREAASAGDLPEVAAQQLKGDLDHIVLMALRKEPEARYAGVEELRADIQRHIKGFPVRASQFTLVYAIQKFVLRHRWGVAASVLGAVAAIAAGAMIWWQGKQAELRFNQVRRLANAVVFELHDAIQNLPGSTAARKLLVERALEYLQNLEATGGKNRDLQRELASAYIKIGAVQGSLGQANFADSARAMQSFQRARKILHEVVRAEPDDFEAQRQLEQADARLADIYQQRGDSRSWKELRDEALQILRADLAKHPESRAVKARLAWHQAYDASTSGEHKLALTAWTCALAANDAALAEAPRDDTFVRTAARIHRNLAQAYRENHDSETALDHFRRAEQIDNARLSASPSDTQRKLDLSWDLTEIGWLEHELKQEREAVVCFERALALQQELAAADPDNFLARIEVAKLKLTAAPAYERAGRPEKAIENLRSAAAAFESALSRDTVNSDLRFHHGWAWSNLGDVYVRRSDWRSAAPCYERAAQTLRTLEVDDKLDDGLNPKALLAHVARRAAKSRLLIARLP